MSTTTDPYGWAAKPRDVSELLHGQKANRVPELQAVGSTNLPDTPLVKAVMEYAKKELNTETFNHSMRVYYYGMLSPSSLVSSVNPPLR